MRMTAIKEVIVVEETLPSTEYRIQVYRGHVSPDTLVDEFLKPTMRESVLEMEAAGYKITRMREVA